MTLVKTSLEIGLPLFCFRPIGSVSFILGHRLSISSTSFCSYTWSLSRWYITAPKDLAAVKSELANTLVPAVDEIGIILLLCVVVL